MPAACSIPARCFRSCTAAPSSAACTCGPASCRFPISRGFDQPAGTPSMTDTLKARDAKDVEKAVQWALGEDKALEILGHGSKRTIGRPSQTDVALDLSALSGVT